MKRKIYAKLVEWKYQEHHKPLILNGVRLCGKTYILKESDMAKRLEQLFVAQTLIKNTNSQCY